VEAVEMMRLERIMVAALFLGIVLGAERFFGLRVGAFIGFGITFLALGELKDECIRLRRTLDEQHRGKL
jgi:hypothetical protein